MQTRVFYSFPCCFSFFLFCQVGGVCVTVMKEIEREKSLGLFTESKDCLKVFKLSSMGYVFSLSLGSLPENR